MSKLKKNEKLIRTLKLQLAHRLFMIDTAIYIMRRADAWNSLSMSSFQNGQDKYVKKECTLHKCGNTACFAGHVAVSPEFIAFGGKSDEGNPFIPENEEEGFFDAELTEEDAILTWLDLYEYSHETTIFVNSMIFGDLNYNGAFAFSDFYNMTWEDVKSEHVIKKLKKLKKIVKKCHQRELMDIKHG